MADPTSGKLGPRSSDSSVSIFRETSNIHIHGGTFSAYGTIDTDKKQKIEDVVDLSLRAEHGAPYDAAAREDVPKCHEHTRVAIIKSIHKWAYSQKPDAQSLMWMYGPAGSGKTTIMQTVAETFDQDGTLAASFFFSRLSAARPREKDNFVITIAHQLSLHIPAMKQLIADALSDSSLLTKSLAKQLDALVIGPWNMLDHAQISSRCIFLIDGLDECKGDAAQRHVLDLLKRFLHQARNRVRILVASRSLAHIQVFFSRGIIAEITQTTPLDNHYGPDEDIATFLTAEFGKVRDEHPASGGLPTDWPPRSAIDALVKRASGQFIYATVIMTYIADYGRHPDESLQTIMGLKASGNERPYDELDTFYAEILSTVEPQNAAFVRDIMGFLLLDKDRYSLVRADAFSEVADFLFMAQRGTTNVRINRIHPLIMTKGTGGIHFAHASFPDYLLDQSRSKEFFLDLRKVHCSLACSWFRLFSEHFKLRQNGTIIPHNSKYFQSRCIEDSLPVQGQDWTVFLDMVQHCVHAEWTSELRQEIIAFDFQAALKIGPESTSSSKNIRWEASVLWLDLTFWAERTGRLSSAEAEQIRGRIKYVIQSTLLELSTGSEVRTTAVLLTWFGHFDIRDPWIEIEDNIDENSQHLGLIAGFHPYRKVCIGSRTDSSRMWFCETLAPDLAMSGSFFSDGNVYADITLLMAKKSKIRSKYYCYLPIMLSKASPSEELATFLIHNLLQIPRSYLLFPTASEGDNEIEQFFMGICIYLFECGITLFPEHQHNQEYDPTTWVCGICLLFEPFGSKCANIELSQVPMAKLRRIVVDMEAHQYLRINVLHQFVPGVVLLWLQTWIFWLADMMARFVPVVA